MGEEVIGKVIEGTIHNARCEFTSGVQMGDAVAVKIGSDEYRARIDHLETTAIRGLIGYIIFIERPHRPPKAYSPVMRRTEDKKGLLVIGKGYRGNEISVDINPLYNHLLLVGKTQQGKTHLMLVLLEELRKYQVPCLVFDTQGEFVNLEGAVVVENISTPDLLAHLRERRIVIINLLGLANPDKTEKLSTILNPLIVEKEKDYAQAENRYELLTLPPTLVFVDEAEIYCPKIGVRPKWAHRSAEACEEIAKRGSKLGLGITVSTQRIINLSIDVRDNCNSIMAFRVSGRSNLTTLGQMSLFSDGTLKRLKALLRGECIILGSLTGGGAITVKTRDITTQRAKNVNFEELLGIESRNSVKPTEFMPSIKIEDGNVVDEAVNEVILSVKKRFTEEDELAFEQDEGDGVVLREEAIPDEVLEELKEAEKKLPFDTHLTDEDEELIKELRKLNEGNNV